MADYSRCIPIIIQHEGVYSEDPEDTGGPTKYGVCLTFAKDTNNMRLFDKNLDGKITKADIKMLTLEDATNIFKAYFWDKYRLDEEPSNKKALVI